MFPSELLLPIHENDIVNDFSQLSNTASRETAQQLTNIFVQSNCSYENSSQLLAIVRRATVVSFASGALRVSRIARVTETIDLRERIESEAASRYRAVSIVFVRICRTAERLQP